jgi:hypothetical protein
MDDVLRRRFEQQRNAAIGSSVGDGESGQGNQAKDILRRSFERTADEVREQQTQGEETRRERAMRYWKEANNESEEQ